MKIESFDLSVEKYSNRSKTGVTVCMFTGANLDAIITQATSHMNFILDSKNPVRISKQGARKHLSLKVIADQSISSTLINVINNMSSK